MGYKYILKAERQVLEFFIYLVTVAITPGPNTISSMANAAEKGLKGVTFNVGMLIGITFISTLSYLLISTLSKYIPILSLLLQILGIAYLVYLGNRRVGGDELLWVQLHMEVTQVPCGFCAGDQVFQQPGSEESYGQGQ